jgi:hypothetical protein
MARFFNLPESYSNVRIEMLSLPAGHFVIPSKRSLRSEGFGRAALRAAFFAAQKSALGSLP